MTTAVFRGPGQVDFVIAPTAAPGSGEVVVFVDACGVCPFERGLFTGKIPWYPVAPGHEVTGVVTGLGADVPRHWMGMRVIADLMRRCGQCPACQANHSAVCTARPRTLCGQIIDLGHGFSDQLLLPLTRVRAVPHVAREEAVLAEPFACVLHALRVSGHQRGQPAAVVGGGVMAALFTLALRHTRTPVTVVSRHTECRQRCAQLGADTSQEVPGCQASMFLLSSRAAGQTMAALQPGGRLVVFAGGAGSVELPALDEVHRHGYAVIGSYSHEPADWDTTATLLRRGVLRSAAEQLIGGRVPLHALPEALDTMNQPGRRVIVTRENYSTGWS